MLEEFGQCVCSLSLCDRLIKDGQIAVGNQDLVGLWLGFSIWLRFCGCVSSSKQLQYKER